MRCIAGKKIKNKNKHDRSFDTVHKLITAPRRNTIYHYRLPDIKFY